MSDIILPKAQTPECRKCNTPSVVADAGMLTYKPYFYCRKCKIELDFYGYEKRQLKNVADEEPQNASDSVGYKMGTFPPSFTIFTLSDALPVTLPPGYSIKFEAPEILNKTPVSVEYSLESLDPVTGKQLWHTIKAEHVDLGFKETFKYFTMVNGVCLESGIVQKEVENAVRKTMCAMLERIYLFN